MRSRRIPTPTETFDEPWKQIVTRLFRPFLEFFAPAMAQEIDWQREVVFLDKELRRIAKGFGRRRRSTADILAQVWNRQGEEQRLIVHIELQAQREATFDERMFLYTVRAYDLYRHPVTSIAVLADTDADWRPDRFGYRSAVSETAIRFTMVKLLDYRGREALLEATENPFGLAALAHLKTQETRGDAEARLDWKRRLARMLFSRQWTRQEIEELFQFLDWIMSLPEPLEDRFEADYQELERSETMAERMPPLMRRAHDRGQAEGIEIGEQRGLQIGEERGIEIGRNEGARLGAESEARAVLLRLGRKRLGEPGRQAAERISALSDREVLEQLCERVLDVETWDELFPGD